MNILVDMNLSPKWTDYLIVIQTRTDVLAPDIIGSMVIRAINLLSEDIERGALVTIDLRRTRVSMLPL